jgi:hypothetical protein
MNENEELKYKTVIKDSYGQIIEVFVTNFKHGFMAPMAYAKNLLDHYPTGSSLNLEISRVASSLSTSET